MEYIHAKNIVIKTRSTSWFGTDYNMNLYRGCDHGCIYCDSRSKCYKIENFESVKVKENALMIVRNDLRRKVKKGIIGMGAMSDPYNCWEKSLNLTRNSLELINASGFGVSIATKSNLILRDLDILKDIKEHSPVICKITITTTDDELAKKIEPNAPAPSIRLDAINQLSRNGIFVGVILMPVLPFITDTTVSIKNIIEKSFENGAKFIYPFFGVTLRDEQRQWYYNKLKSSFGEDILMKYIKKYNNTYACMPDNKKELYYEFSKKCNELGILYKMNDIIKLSKLGYENKQISLF